MDSRTDLLHYRLVAKVDGADVYGDDQDIRLSPGKYLSCSGFYDYMNCGSQDMITGANPRSVSVWAYTDLFNKERPLFIAGASGVTGSDFSFYTLTTDNEWRVELGGTASFDVSLPGSKLSWHHYCLTYDGTDVKLYYDGYLAGSSTVVLNTVLNDFLIAKSTSGSSDFDGKIDEISYWGKALSEGEIRDLMHQPLAGNETDLLKYIPMDGEYSKIFDLVTGQEISYTADKYNSTCPLGVGAEFTAAEAAGTVTFTGTGFDAAYSSQNGATVIVSKIEIEPNATNGFSGSTTILDNQYWVAHRHGSGSFSADVTFTVSEDLTAADQSTPTYIQLYSRDKGSYGDWSLVGTASSVSAADDKATFNGIDTFDKQFIISRNTDPTITATENSLTYNDTEVGGAYQQHSYELLGTNLTANLDVTPPTGFQVSTDAGSGFAASLSLAPSSGSVSETIYVRLTPTTAGTFSGDVANSSTGATTTNVNIPQVEVYDVAANALNFDGSDDYVQLTHNSGLPIYNNGTGNAYSVCMWVKGNTQNDKRIFAEGRSTSNNPMFTIGTNTSGKIRMYIRDDSNSELLSATSSTTVFDDTWHHIAWVDNNGSATLYVDGVADGNNFNYTRGTLTLDRSAIGTVLRASPAAFFSGQIDEVSIWNVARSQSEIRDNMHRTLNGNESNLTAYYRFDRISGTVLSDRTANNNNGILINMADADWVSSTAIWKRWKTTGTSDWSTTGNWSTTFSEPTANDMVLILSGGTQPLISNNPESPAVCDILQIENGAILTLNSGKTLTVSETLTNNAGNAGLVIKSDPTGSGSLIHNTANVDATVERYITQWADGTHGWHFLASPVETFNIVGSAFEPGADDDLYGWDETTDLWMNHKDGNPSQIVTGTGYLTAWASTSTKSFVGTLNSSDITFTNLSHTTANDFTGWHLLGNPFPCALLWNVTSWGLINVDGVAKIWNEANASYSDIAQNEVIPSMQGFMVNVSSASNSITIPLADRSHNATAWFKDAEVNKITLTAYDIEGGTAQKSIIKFNENATSGFDNEFDSWFLAGYAPQFYSVIPQGNISTNTLPGITYATTIPMSFIKNTSSTYRIEAEGVVDLVSQENVYLTDIKTNHTQLLNDNPVYEFTSEEGDIHERFIVHFSPLGINDMPLGEQINIFSSGNYVEIRSSIPVNGKINIYNISGQLIGAGQLNNESSSTINISNYKGVAMVSIITSGQTLTEKVIIW